ncbi:TetR/AcrR family transcriptional regulator [Neobacillus sp. PS3-40]|uniref:TetR/AcrR family transcriptional regulator n=1 Tax=Neobacillus sp. PS3-40 TaxID=3070679 RepID=UPI0027DF083C|nr:TetR/AcrR family transcriptional regulator [Neobacillus sp. PS3-40]WML44017.1 TetR/AcrR family transcriptional regulator [Neobacillus sp. PS3-40]
MNDRKQHVINMAHQLFIDKGFQATSIQDILEYSGISKGTFYNYFPSKNALFIALFKSIHKKIEHDRNELLIGKDPSDIEVFIKQIEVQMKENQKNKVLSLFEEVIYSKDEDLKQFVKKCRIMMLRWLYNRFIEIFGDSKKPYLLDIAIMFMGILNHNVHFNYMALSSGIKFPIVVRYSVERLIKMVDEVAESGEQLLEPEYLERWLPDCQKNVQGILPTLYHTVLSLKKMLNYADEQSKYIELLDFVQEELVHSKTPRKFLIESTLQSLKAVQTSDWTKEIQKLEQLVEEFFEQVEDI